MRAQHGALLPWTPVFLALGIGAWFALPFEPVRADYLALAALLAAGAVLYSRVGEVTRPLVMAALLLGAGAGLAGLRAHHVAAPVLEFRYYGPVEGRILAIDRAGSGATRLTLDRVRLEDVSPARTPARVRLSLYGPQDWIAPAPGLTVMLTGHLSPPPGPVEPGGFDFARMAWFDRLGAVGYTRAPVLMAAPAEGRAVLVIPRLRAHLSTAIQEALPGERGAFATAILTGDRSAIPPESLEHLRRANLAHLLAISGLHMGLLTGVVFAALRIGFALVPWLALRLPTRKIAAVAALAAGAAYLAISGGNVATLRAFVMISVIFTAVLLDRRAISLRSVAIAATLILALRPEALAGPGFQMSFAATTALVGVFAVLQRHVTAALPRWVLPAVMVLLSSAVAGAATAPVAAAHFNRFTDYGLIANLLSVPLMGTVVMPAAVVAAVLAPVGLAGPPLAVMGAGLAWILGVAEWVSGLPGSVTAVVAPGPAVLPLLALGALVVLLWQGHARWLGLLPALAGALLWAQTERPALLVARDGGLIGLMGPEGRVLSKATGGAFAAETWLENDGDPAGRDVAARRPGLPGDRAQRVFDVGPFVVAHVTGRGREARTAEVCGAVDILIVNTALATSPPGDCRLLDARALRETGAVAIHDDGRIVTATGAKDRLWTAR